MTFAPRLKRGAVLADVTSANIVGYNTATVAGKAQLGLALQFDDMEGAKSIPIDKLFVTDKPVGTTKWDDSNMDQIWVWKNGSWTKYGCVRSGTPPNFTYTWKRYDYLGKDTPVFVDLTDDDVVEYGYTFIFKRGGSNAATLTFSGQVKPFDATPAYSIDGKAQKFICYPWPVNFLISKIANYYSSPAGTTKWDDSNMDQIWVWKNGSWAKYGCVRSGTPPNFTYTWMRYDYLGKEKGEFVNLDDATDYVPAGQGFIFKRGGSKVAEINFTFGEKAAE